MELMLLGKQGRIIGVTWHYYGTCDVLFPARI